MTSHALLPRLLPGGVFLTLASLSILLNFNGLYGQDAHEYLRQGQVLFARLRGLPAPAASLGDAEFASGYPFAGALLHFLTGDSVLALQCVSWLSAALGLWVFVRLLELLAPGGRAESRWAYTGLAFALAPLLFRAGMTSMSDGMGLALVLAALFYGLRSFERRYAIDAVWAGVFVALAVFTRYALAALLLPLAGAIGYSLWQRRKWRILLGSVLLGAVGSLPHFWIKTAGVENPLGHSMLQYWSAGNFFQSAFSNENGLSRYALPNVFYLFFPLMHPAFCLLLPGLFFLFKKTDVSLASKKLLLVCIAAYLLLLGGLPHQNLRHLLPAYTLLLLLLFPAWDRLYCYGFVFFRRITTGILVTALVVQVCCCALYFAPVFARNRLETAVAAQLSAILPPNATVYSFDLDVALRSYLPELQLRNLWERRYEAFPAGGYVLFNEALRPQWQGQNPVLNWDELNKSNSLEQKAVLPEAWGLWEIR